MLIAILYAAGVGPGVILVLLLGLMLLKRYRTIKDPAVFKARVRLADGDAPGLEEAWKRCYGAWVTTVFTTRKGLPLNIRDVLPIARLDGPREATPDDGVKGLGDAPLICSFTMTTAARIEVAMPADKRAVALEPWHVAEPSPSMAEASPPSPLG